MDYFIEKISCDTNKTFFTKLFFSKFLRSLKEIIDNTKEEEASLTEKAKFFVLANENMGIF